MKIYTILILFVLLLFQAGCDDFVDIGEPRNELVKASVFTDESTAEAAVADLYISLRDGFAGGRRGSLAGLGSLISDELDLYITYQEYQEINDNEITPNNSLIESLWSDMYSVVYKANAILEGLDASNIDESVKNQLKGEAVFIRAYTYFYLVNLWGDVPLVLATDYRINNDIGRASIEEVYGQIVVDLLDAKSLLREEYSGERIRANQAAAMALLARVYLFLEEWQKAEAEATKVIENDLYSLEGNLNLVFRTSSKEAILQLWHLQSPNQYPSFLMSSLIGPLFGTLRPQFLNSFSPEDLRMSSWIVTKTAVLTGSSHTGVGKYKTNAIPPEDYSTILRLAEQYLIRAEARAQQNNLTGAAEDLNLIRLRSGLAATKAGTQEEMIESIFVERMHELFSEECFRWLDLKRAGKATEVLSPLKPSWDKRDVLFPIPESQIISNPNISQNPIG